MNVPCDISVPLHSCKDRKLSFKEKWIPKSRRLKTTYVGLICVFLIFRNPWFNTVRFKPGCFKKRVWHSPTLGHSQSQPTVLISFFFFISTDQVFYQSIIHDFDHLISWACHEQELGANYPTYSHLFSSFSTSRAFHLFAHLFPLGSSNIGAIFPALSTS